MKKLILVLALILSGCSVVAPGERGVHIWFGEASNTVLQPGAHFWIPFIYKVEKVDIQVQKSEVTTSAGSKDLQPIETKVVINWSIAPDQVVDVYRRLGDEAEIYARIISPAVSEVLKASMAQLNAEEMMVRRLELKKSIDDGLRTRLAAYGVNASDVSIIDLKFSDQFINAVEAKQVAEQQSKQAQYVADKAIKDAEAAVNLAQGQAKAQQLIQSSITPGVLQKMAIEKWDGKFPQYMTGNQLPFLTTKLGN